MCLLPWAFAHTSHTSRSEIEVQQVVDWKHVINMWNYCVSEHLLRFQSFCSSCWMWHSDSGASFSAGTVHSERLFEKKIMFHCITLFSLERWRMSWCAIKTFFMHNIMQACLWVFAVIRVFTLFSFGFSDFSSRYFFELGNLVIFNDNVLIVYLLIYKINLCNLLIFIWYVCYTVPYLIFYIKQLCIYIIIYKFQMYIKQMTTFN